MDKNTNPLQFFFGSSVVAALRLRPGMIRKITERVKPYLIAQHHPDINPGGTSEASSISEAYLVLKNASDEEVTEMADSFLVAAHRDRNDLVHRLREATRSLNRSESLLRARDEEIISLSKELGMRNVESIALGNILWSWFLSGSITDKDLDKTLPETLFPTGSILRGQLHHYRMIVQRDDGVFIAYQFDLGGRRTLLLESNDLDMVRVAHLFGNDPPLKKVRVFRRIGSTLIGSMDSHPSGAITVRKAMNDAMIHPYVMIGKRPVFSFSKDYKGLVVEKIRTEGCIVEMIPLKAARKKLVEEGVIKKKAGAPLKARLKAYKEGKR